MRKYQVRFWRATALVRESLTLIILKLALSTTGHVGTWVTDPNASGDLASTLIGAILSEQAESTNEESPWL